MGAASERDRMGLQVLVTSAYPDPEPITSFRSLIAQDRFGLHQLTDDPDEADVILFVENSHYGDDPYFRTLRRHPWVRAYREKCFMYNEHDRPWCVLPGLYFSMPKNRINWARQRPCAYVREINPRITYTDPECAEPRHLFSFVGRRYPGVRSRILALQYPGAVVRDTSAFRPYARHDRTGAKAGFLGDFAETMEQSRFVLCPRGVATSSLRPFETMKVGRVPAIISDQYALPVGPDWESFAVFVPERDVERLPETLERLDDRWRQMATRARHEWETWFAPDVLFHRMIDDCAELLDLRRRPESVAQRIPQFGYIEWRLRALARGLRSRASAIQHRE